MLSFLSRHHAKRTLFPYVRHASSHARPATLRRRGLVAAGVLLGASSGVLASRIYADTVDGEEIPDVHTLQARRATRFLDEYFGDARRTHQFDTDVVKCTCFISPAALEEGEDEDGVYHQLSDVNDGLWMQFLLVNGQDDCTKEVREKLTHSVVGHLADLYKEPDAKPTLLEIDSALKHAFLDFDDYLVNVTADDAIKGTQSQYPMLDLHTSQSSTSALHAFYDTRTRMLHVSNVGECRAVLGRRNKKGLYDVYQMSHEHLLSNATESARLLSEHPDETEDDMSSFVRLTRAFGLGHLKWGRDVYKLLFSMRLAQPISPSVKSPPYVTAEPEIIRMMVQPGDFLIFGDPGLWDSLTNEEAVGIVGSWVEWRKTSGLDDNRRPPLTLTPTKLPVVLGEDHTEAYKRWSVQKEFLMKDNTPAKALARNALGGKDELLTYLLVRNLPLPRMWRKHLKCAVITFE